jgi:transcription elongation factor Elf1
MQIKPSCTCPCGNCEVSTSITFGKLQADEGYTCSHCGQRNDLAGEDVQATLDDLNEAIRRLAPKR